MIRNRVANKSISAFHLAFYKAALPVMIQRLEMLPPEYVAAQRQGASRGRPVSDVCLSACVQDAGLAPAAVAGHGQRDGGATAAPHQRARAGGGGHGRPAAALLRGGQEAQEGAAQVQRALRQ